MFNLQALTSDGSRFVNKLRDYFLTVSEGTVELTINLVVMVLVERIYDQQGLGVYAYLLSLLFILGYISEFGIPRYAEHEIAKTADLADAQLETLSHARQASLSLSLLLSTLLFLSAGYDAAHTQISEKAAAYLIIGAILPLRSLNALKLSVLHGYGKHDVVAKLQTTKRVIFLGAISLLLLIHVPPSYLFLAFFGREVFLAIAAAMKLKFPQIRKTWKGLKSVRTTRYFIYSKEIQKNIEEKKLKDQLVFKNQAEARAAIEEAKLKKIEQEGKVVAAVEMEKGKAYVTRKIAERDLYARKKKAEADLLVQLAEAEKVRLKNDALKGLGAERMVGLKMADAYKGLELIVLPSDGPAGVNPLDLDNALKLFDVRTGGAK